MNWKSIALNARALAVGVLVASLLVTAVTLVQAIATESAAGGPILVPPESRAIFALMYSPLVAVLIAVVCVPAWLLLARAGLDRWYAAAMLGFVAVMAYWVVDNLPSWSVLELARSGLVYGICGAVAGVATWWARPR